MTQQILVEERQGSVAKGGQRLFAASAIRDWETGAQNGRLASVCQSPDRQWVLFLNFDL
jgi:hypothetical protein